MNHFFDQNIGGPNALSDTISTSVPPFSDALSKPLLPKLSLVEEEEALVVASVSTIVFYAIVKPIVTVLMVDHHLMALVVMPMTRQPTQKSLWCDCES